MTPTMQALAVVGSLALVVGAVLAGSCLIAACLERVIEAAEWHEGEQ